MLKLSPVNVVRQTGSNRSGTYVDNKITFKVCCRRISACCNIPLGYELIDDSLDVGVERQDPKLEVAMLQTMTETT